MASILKVDELRGIASAGDITVTSEGGAATQSLQQGLAKSWGRMIGGTGTESMADSFNVASLTDNGSNLITFTRTNNTSSANYAISSIGYHRPGISEGPIDYYWNTASTSAHQQQYRGNAGNTYEDMFFTIHGDLA